MMTPALISALLPPGAEGDVVIIKPSSLGDVVHTLPAVAWLRQGWPQLRLHWVVNREWAPVLEGCPLLESVIVFPRGDFRGVRGLWRSRQWFKAYAQSLAPLQVRLALDFQGLLRSAWLARGSGARCILGLDDAREGSRFFHTASVGPSAGEARVRHAVDRYLGLVSALEPGCDSAAAVAGDWLPAGEVRPGWPVEGFVVLHPFARGAGKSLGWEGVVAMAEVWRDFPVVVVGRTDEPPPRVLPESVINLVNATTLLQLIGLLRRASFVVSVDSGPMHLASALRRPLLGLHTWSDPRKVGPYDPGAWVWKAGRILRRHEVDDALAGHAGGLDPAALRLLADFVAGKVRAASD